MDRLKGIGSSLAGAAGNMMDKSKLGEKISYLKESYLNKVYEIGNRRFTVKKLIAEGGFGFVFLVKEFGTERQYALKKMIVQDKERVGAIKNEVNLMKILAHHPHMVCLEDHKMIDNRTELEVLLLMEYCSCSLLEAMNRGSLRNEQEIYNVFSQVCTAVARLHANNPPISHRDLKVENILLGEDGRWKLCDFGSATTATYLPTSERERSVAEEDINRNTTMLYRAPEMVDLYRRQPINEKVDVWALGCVLYKMAYGVDPFDGGLGIMNARYTFPEFRKTTPEFEGFIGYLLNPDPTLRPSIQQVQERLAALRGVPAPQVSSPPSAHPQTNITLPNGNNQQTNTRPATAPPKAAAAPAADLVDWGDSGSTKSPPQPLPSHQPPQQQHPQLPPPNALHNSAPLPNQHQHAKPPPTQQPQQFNKGLFDALDWQGSPASQPSTPPKTSPPAQSRRSAHPPTTPSKPQTQAPDLLNFSDAPKQPTQPQQPTSKSSSGGDLDFLEFSNPISKPPQPTHHHPHQNSPSRPSPPASAQPPAKPTSNPPVSKHASKSDGPDLLDFSDPPPKVTNAPTIVMHPGFLSPQPYHQTYYSPPPTTHYSPTVPHVSHHHHHQIPPNRTVPGPDPLAQFAKPMQKSLPDVDDFDPLAPKKPSSTSTPAPSSSSSSPSLSQQQVPNNTKLSAPPAPSSSRAKHDAPSLIDF